MRGCGHITLLGIAVAWLLGTQPLQAQWQPRDRRDSLAHPQTAPGSEAMRFEERRIDAGDLNEDDAPMTYTYRWSNAGREPLAITRVQTTCGCAKATYDKQPVRPGGEGEVRVTYYPKGHPGRFERRIFVYTQLSDTRPTAILELTGHAAASALPVHDYSYEMGPLRLKQNTVRIGGTERQTERIECLNAGQKALRLTADRGLLPEYMEFECEPAVLEPGKTGDLVVRFDPAKAPQTLPRQAMILLDGIALPPSQRMLRIEIGENERK